MGAIESHHIYGLQIRESATDGSDFSNPDTDYRVLFLGEDGLLHLRDAAGTITTPGASGAITSSGLTMATARLLGRTTASTGAVEEISVGSGLSLAAGSLSATGGGSALTVEEADGSPTDSAVTKIVVPNGSLSIASHVATVRQVPFGFIGARVTNTAGTSYSSGAEVAMPFASEDYDTDGFHDTVTNNTRVTVPAGMGGKYRLTGQVAFASGGAASRYAYLQKNGATLLGITEFNPGATVASWGNLSADVDLAAGDYVELIASQSTGGSISLQTTAGRNWLTITKLEAGRVGSGVGARAYKSGTQSLTTATWTSILFDTESFDTDAFHDTGSNTSRMTVPAGLAGKYLAVGAILYAQAAAGSRYIALAKNGTRVAQFQKGADNLSGEGWTISDTFDLVAGDYIELQGYQDSGSSLNVQAATYLSLVKLDTAPGMVYEHIIKANVSGSQTVTAGADHVIAFAGADSWDAYSGHDPSTNNGERFYAPANGRYKFTVQVNYGSSPGGGYLQFVDSNSTSYGALYGTTGGSARGSYIYSQTMDMVAGAYMTVHGFRTSGTAGPEAGGFMEMERVA